MSLISLGRKVKRYMGMTAGGKEKKKTVTEYPTFHVSGIALPVSEADVGKEIMAVVKLKVNRAGAEIDEYEDPSRKTYRAAFSIKGIQFNNRKKINIKNFTSEELDEMERTEHGLLSG